MDGDYPIFAKARLRRALITSFTTALAWLCVWAGPPVQFSPPINSAIGDPSRDSIAIATADFNGDGNMDLAAGSGMLNDLEILIGAGDGTFQVKTNYFVLESAEDLSATNNWVAVTNSPAVVGDRKILANSIAKAQRYFRLLQP